MMYVADADLTRSPLLAAMEKVTDFFAVLDRAWRLVHLDARSLKTLGMEPEQAIGQVFWRVFPACRNTITERRLLEAMMRQQAESFRAPGPASGQLQDLHLFPSPTGLMVVARDVVDYEGMELQLKQADERLAAKLTGMRRLHEIGTQLMREADLDSLIRKTVESAIEITHADIAILHLVDPHDLRLSLAAHSEIDQPLAAFLHSDEGQGPLIPMTSDRTVVLEDITQSPLREGTRALQVLAEAGVRTFQAILLLNRDGAKLGILSTCYKERHQPLEREMRFLDLFALQAAELIQRTRSQVALQESETRLREREDQLRLITNAAPALISYIDSDFRYRLVNAAYERWFGLSAEQIKGKHVREVLGDLAWDALRPRMERALAGEEVTWEQELPYQAGGRRWVRGTYTPHRDEAGQIPGFVVLVNDIGAAKRAEQALRESEERLRALNRDLERRVSERTAEVTERAAQLQALAAELTMAEERERRRLAQLLHDHLQQLLVGAKIRTAVISRKVQDTQVQQELARLSSLLHDAIQESRSLTAQLSPPILYDAGLGPALLWLSRWIEGNHGISVNVEVDSEAEPTSMEVRAFLFQACRELLLNVVKHARVDAADVRLRLVETGVVELVVEDRGKGWEHGTAAAGPPSGGFGLFSIRQRLEHLGGTLEVTSQPGQGTRACLRLKTAHATDRVPGALAPASPALSEQVSTGANRIRVLLADDQKILREGLSALLRDQPDLEIVGEAADGAEAVALALAVRPHVVVMDASMPQLNGIEATRRLRTELPGVQVIGLSMYSEHEMAAAMRQAGAAAYLTKDGPVEMLAAEIRRVAHAGVDGINSATT
jgi:PAS domain S-box-containing protein